jgi:MerR family transcriptional regulator, thiopeptide resistance regulator
LFDSDITSPFILKNREEAIYLDQKFYQITEFSRKAFVSIRTLRYYDKLELLVPSHYNESGYKLYTQQDLIKLQYILSLKFLGFSLNEIKDFLKIDPQKFQHKLIEQKSMLKEQKAQIEKIIAAIENVEKTLDKDQIYYDSIIEAIQIMQMNLKPDWIKKYLTTEERKTMREIVKQSYSKEALRKLISRNWTNEDQNHHFKQYQYFRETLTKLVNEGTAPESKEAQELSNFLFEMNNSRTKGDPILKDAMKKSWENFNSLPDEQKPKFYTIPDNERAFIKEASIIFHRNKT